MMAMSVGGRISFLGSMGILVTRLDVLKWEWDAQAKGFIYVKEITPAMVDAITQISQYTRMPTCFMLSENKQEFKLELPFTVEPQALNILDKWFRMFRELYNVRAERQGWQLVLTFDVKAVITKTQTVNGKTIVSISPVMPTVTGPKPIPQISYNMELTQNEQILKAEKGNVEVMVRIPLY